MVTQVVKAGRLIAGGHPEMVPLLPPGKEEGQCVAQPINSRIGVGSETMCAGRPVGV